MSPASQSHVLMHAIAALPPEKVQEIVDFAVFLQQRYGDPSKIEYDDTWTDEDLQALTRASLEYAERTILKDEPPYNMPTS